MKTRNFIYIQQNRFLIVIFCLTLSKFGIELVEVLSFSIIVFDLSLYLGLHLDLFKVLVI